MKAVGIIAEYNPFHNGHAYQIAEVKRRESPDVVIAAMSGHFTQRGEASVFTKWQRAQLALAGGADLVVELPFVFAVRSAEYFARGGVRLLHELGITHLAFGAESDDIEPLLTSARAQLRPDLAETLAPYLAKGLPYAAALSTMLEEKYHISPAVLASPNNILGAEYLKAILRYAPTAEPIHIVRHGSTHHSTSLEHAVHASSSAIRKNIADDRFRMTELASYIPPATHSYLTRFYEENGGIPSLERLSPFVFGLLATTDKKRLSQTVGISEGLENKFLSASHTATSLEELLDLVKTKRYPRTRLTRTVLHYLFGTTQESVSHFDEIGPQYIRILGMNERGQDYLRTRKKTMSVPIITKLTPFFNQYDLLSHSDDPLKQMLAFDVRSTNLYARLFSSPLAQNQDFTTSPIRYLL
ncbi:MAG: nucleotidyltransferase [Selenomonadales bacterium]|nr:nucleotidyltransferase [Selenomonadales bacterium]